MRQQAEEYRSATEAWIADPSRVKAIIAEMQDTLEAYSQLSEVRATRNTTH